MNARLAYAALRKLDATVIRTSDAAAAWRQSPSAAAKMLAKLAEAALITQVRHGLWWIDGAVDPYRLAPYLTAPLESYLSLQTALQLRGLIEQIPEGYYAATLARTRRLATAAGTFSFHHLAPEVFGGYEETATGVKLATAEKALFDWAYLSAGRSRLFTALPEFELPRGFRHAELTRWLARVPSSRSRTITSQKLEAWLAGSDGARRSPMR
jgi:predicted transcriptional regulator of viral defense system